MLLLSGCWVHVLRCCSKGLSQDGCLTRQGPAVWVSGENAKGWGGRMAVDCEAGFVEETPAYSPKEPTIVGQLTTAFPSLGNKRTWPSLRRTMKWVSDELSFTGLTVLTSCLCMLHDLRHARSNQTNAWMFIAFRLQRSAAFMRVLEQHSGWCCTEWVSAVFG